MMEINPPSITEYARTQPRTQYARPVRSSNAANWVKVILLVGGVIKADIVTATTLGCRLPTLSPLLPARAASTSTSGYQRHAGAVANTAGDPSKAAHYI